MERNIDVNQCNPLISDICFKNVQDLYHELPTNRNTTLLTQVWGMAELSLSLRWILWVGGSQLLTWYLTLPQPPLSADYKNVVHHPSPTFAVGSPKSWVQIGEGWDWGEPTNWLGGGFKYLLCSPLLKLGEDEPIWRSYFWIGLEPPTSWPSMLALLCCANKIHKVW